LPAGTLLDDRPDPDCLLARARRSFRDVDKQGYAWLPEEDFINHFAGDVDPIQAKVMFAVQQPLAASAAPKSSTLATAGKRCNIRGSAL